MRVGHYSKAIVAMVGAGLTWALAAYPSVPWFGLAAAVLTAAGVYQIKNQKPSATKKRKR